MTTVRRVLAGSLLIAAFVLMTQDAALAASYDNHVLNAAQQRIIKQQEERRRKLADEFRQSGRTPLGLDSFVTLPLLEVAPGGPRIAVNDISIKGNTVFSTRDLAHITERYNGRGLGEDEITNLYREITNTYIRAGYTTSYAGPDPDASGAAVHGRLSVLVTEGVIEEIVINGGDPASRLQAETAFTGLKGKPLNIHDIVQGLDQLRRVPSNNPEAAIAPGSGRGCKLLVTTNAGRSWRFATGLDNWGYADTGQTQYNLSLDKDNLLGLGDMWSIFWASDFPQMESALYDRQQRGHTNDLLLMFSVPLGYWTFKGEFEYYRYNSAIDGFFHEIGHSGTSFNGRVTAERVVHRDVDHKTTAGAFWNFDDSDTFVEDRKLEALSYNNHAFGISLGHSRNLWNGSLNAALEYCRGVKILGEREPEQRRHNTPRPEYNLFRLNLSWKRPFLLGSQTFSWGLAGEGLYSPDTLYGSDRIWIGSPDTVRGFRESGITGDKGFYLRNELAWAVPWLKSWEQGGIAGMELYCGYDYGMIVNDPASPGERGRLQGAALGLRTTGSLNMDVFIGKALDAPSAVRRKDYELAFIVRYTY